MTNTDKLCEQQADAYVETLTELWEAIDADTEYDDMDPRDYLDQMALEVVWEKGEPFAVVLGTGGPHVEITGGGRSGGYELHVHWGGGHAVRRGEAITRTGEDYRDAFEQLEG